MRKDTTGRSATPKNHARSETNSIIDMEGRHILIILDGYGIAEDPSVSAIDHAEKPFLDELFSKYPHSTLEASGRAVGLPEGQMGNSEVGHMNLGAGRVVYQDITRISKAIRDGSFFENEVLLQAVHHAKENDTALHLMGCFSDGGVHSHLDHLRAFLFEDSLTKVAIAADCQLPFAFLKPDESLGSALERFTESGCRQLPVVSAGDEDHIIGFLSYEDLLLAYDKELIRRGYKRNDGTAQGAA